MTGSDNLMNHPAQRYNTMSPIRTVITTITRESVNIIPCAQDTEQEHGKQSVFLSFFCIVLFVYCFVFCIFCFFLFIS